MSFCGTRPAARAAVVAGNDKQTVLDRFKWFLDAGHFLFCKRSVAETHANEVVGVVVFFGGKVIEVCRVLVLHR